ncbi:hypothetical protein A2J03_29450 [Rhodococcus sp. EPR-157]|uniref:hypothetical protein n=1 Tax=Rhodococcus sp. EPR-157 TaxID=1813677 RepID=UPI0007BBFED4|nr:hypothetical protein [Rhodococcus sp. EPR-157]KZF00772.1 hypothetical protein A2J03_29450 [Rhodococcus sp. EPR-157]
MRKLWLAALAAAFLAGCSTEPEVEQPAKFDLTFVAQAAPRYVERVEGGCATTRIHEGTQVVITDAAGLTVGAGFMPKGTLQQDGSCTFKSVTEVTDSSDFYGLAVNGEDPVMFPSQKAHDGISLAYGY